MTCTAMSGNGVRTSGKTLTLAEMSGIMLARAKDGCVWHVEDPGFTLPRIAGQPIGIVMGPTTIAVTLAFELF